MSVGKWNCLLMKSFAKNIKLTKKVQQNIQQTNPQQISCFSYKTFPLIAVICYFFISFLWTTKSHHYIVFVQFLFKETLKPMNKRKRGRWRKKVRGRGEKNLKPFKCKASDCIESSNWWPQRGLKDLSPLFKSPGLFLIWWHRQTHWYHSGKELNPIKEVRIVNRPIE